MASPTEARRNYEDKVRSWGFSTVFTWTDAPYVLQASPTHPR